MPLYSCPDFAPDVVAKRVLWLAFQAAQAVGMGIWHAGEAARQTEASLWNHLQPVYKSGGNCAIYTDYVFGRQMKTTVLFQIEKHEIAVEPAIPRADYQSWCVKYPTSEELVSAAIKELTEQYRLRRSELADHQFNQDQAQEAKERLESTLNSENHPT